MSRGDVNRRLAEVPISEIDLPGVDLYISFDLCSKIVQFLYNVIISFKTCYYGFVSLFSEVLS